MDEVADRGELRREHLDRIIQRLVPFYEQAATGPRINKFGEPAIIHFNHQENFSRTAGRWWGRCCPRNCSQEFRPFPGVF